MKQKTKNHQHNPNETFGLIVNHCNEYYRDEQRMAKCLVSKGDGDQTGTNGSDTVNDLQNGGKVPKTCRLWDYFTGSKLEFQAGDPVTLPLGTVAPVRNAETIETENLFSPKWYGIDGNQNTNRGYPLAPAQDGTVTTSSFNEPGSAVVYQALETDLSQATAATIRDFKIALMSH